jgi:hypothetical protein
MARAQKKLGGLIEVAWRGRRGRGMDEEMDDGEEEEEEEEEKMGNGDS